jgi:hypothetical protein
MIKVNDILVYLWGYGQTNVDFFIVTKRTQKTAILQPIDSKSVKNYWPKYASRLVVADPEKVIEKQFRKRVHKNNNNEEIIFMDHGIASKWNGKQIEETWD